MIITFNNGTYEMLMKQKLESGIRKNNELEFKMMFLYLEFDVKSSLNVSAS